MKKLKIFIASGSELAEERREAISAINQINKIFPDFQIEPLMWETNIPSGSVEKKRIRDEIDPLLENSDIVLVLFYAQIGSFTHEEFHLALEKKKKILIYFKTGFSSRNITEHRRFEKVLELKEAIEKVNRLLYREYQTHEQFKNYLNQDLNHYLSQNAKDMNADGGDSMDKKYLTRLPPRIVDIIGREDDNLKLEQQLGSKERVLLIQGIGGVGKTELCKYYLYKHLDDYSQVAWIDYRDNLKESLVFQLDISMPSENSLEEKFKKVLSFLANLDKNTLMVIDNIDNPDDEDLGLIASLPFKVIINSRHKLKGFSLYEIDSMSALACRELFYRHYKIEKDDENVDRLLELSSWHTLTVELLARTGQDARLKVKHLLEQLKARGFNWNEVIKERVGTLWRNKSEKRRLFDHLLTIFHLGNVTEEEESIMTNLSVLPSVYIDRGEIKEWLGLESFEGITELAAKGWIKEENYLVYMPLIIQEVVRYQTKPDTVKCRKLIAALADQLDLKPGEPPDAMRTIMVYGEAILNHVEGEDQELAQLANNLSLRYKDLGYLEKALEFQEKAKNIYEKVLEINHPLLAASYNNLSQIYKDLGQLERALEFQEKVLNIRETILPEAHPDLASSYNKLSRIYYMLGNYDKAIELQGKALGIREKILAPLDRDLAESYNNLSMIQYSLGRYEEAAASQAKALRIREIVLRGSHPDLAESYINFALVLKSTGKLNEALDYSKKGVDILRKIFQGKHPRLESAIRFMELTQEILDMQLKNIRR